MQKIVAGVTSVIIALGMATGAFLLTRPHAMPTPKPPGPITREQAIPKAQEYLLHDLDNMDSTLRYIMDFLQRKFNLDPKFSGQTTPIKTASADLLEEYELKAVARMAYKDTLVTDLGPNPTFVARGANCDHIPLPANISGQLQQEIDKGSYELTHAFLAMQLMKELDCSVANADSLRQQTITAMTKMAADEKTENDLRYECMAFLIYAGKYDSIDSAWIDKIYTNQRQDGGWALSQKDQNSDNHTTVLALWALLEYAHPDAPYEPIIHAPSNN